MTDDAPDDAPDLTNGDLARIFHEIGDILELKGELVFKTVAYHRAADAIGRSPVDVVAAYRSGTAPQIPGVGKAISDKLQELATTGHLAYYERLRAEIPPTLVDLLRDRRARPQDRPPAQPGARHRDRRRPAQGRRVRPAADPPRHVGPDRGARARGDRQARRPVRPDAPGSRRGAPDLAHRRAVGHARGRLDRARRLVPPAQGIDRRPGPARGDRPAGGARRRVHPLRPGRFGHQPGRLQGGRPAAARPAGGPDDHAAGRGRHVPDPLHRLQGAQRQAAGDGARPGLEPVREGLPADRRGRRATHRRRGRAADVRHRGGGVRVPRAALHRARAARGHRRDRGGAGRPAAGTSSTWPTCAATSTAIRTGRTAITRSRSWPRPPARAATPTRS